MTQNIIMQGDQYSITFGIDFNDSPLDISTVDTVQFVVGRMVKNYNIDGTGEVSYDNDNKMFIFPLKQEESFKLNGLQNCQVRIKFNDGAIVGGKADPIIFTFSSTKEVI